MHINNNNNNKTKQNKNKNKNKSLVQLNGSYVEAELLVTLGKLQGNH